MKKDYFELLMTKEDGYTNFLKELFDCSKEFRNNLSQALFGEELNDLTFLTRTAFITNDAEQNTKKKNVPDIIIYNSNHFGIIEVKVYAFEGDNQTKNYYDNKQIIKDKLNIKSNSKEKYWFLTLYGTKPSCNKFEAISWNKFGEHLPTKTNDEGLNILLAQLKERINSIKGNKKITLNSNWCESVKSEKWEGAVNLFNALKLIPLFKNKNYSDYDNYWDEFTRASNEYHYKSQFTMNKQWVGKRLERITNNYSECYQIHFEFEWSQEHHYLVYRLDYHLNPYYSNNDIKRYLCNEEEKNKANTCNIKRQAIAQSCREIWRKTYCKGYNDFEYNKRIQNNLLVLLSGWISVKDDMAVKDVVEYLQPRLEAANDFAEVVLLPTIREESLAYK